MAFAQGARISDTSMYVVVPVVFDNFPKVVVPSSVNVALVGHAPL